MTQRYKFLKILLIILIASFNIYAVATYLQPKPGRYVIERYDNTVGGLVSFGYLVKDTGTGKIYDWNTRVVGPNEYNIKTEVLVRDPVHAPYRIMKVDKTN